MTTHKLINITEMTDSELKHLLGMAAECPCCGVETEWLTSLYGEHNSEALCHPCADEIDARYAEANGEFGYAE